MGVSPGPITREFLEWSALFWRYQFEADRWRREQERISDWRMVTSAGQRVREDVDFQPGRVIATDPDGSPVTAGDWKKLFADVPVYDGGWASSPEASDEPPAPPDGWEDTKADFWFLYYCAGCQGYWDALAAQTETCAGSGCATVIQNCHYDGTKVFSRCRCERVCVPDGEGVDNGCTGDPVPFWWDECPLVPSTNIDWEAVKEAAEDEWDVLISGLLGGGIGSPSAGAAGCEHRYPGYPTCAEKRAGGNFYESLYSAKKEMKSRHGRDTSFSKDKFRFGMTTCEGGDQPEHWTVYDKDEPSEVLDTIVCCQCCQGASGESGTYLQKYCSIAYDG